MMDRMRRKMLKTGAAATVMAAAPRVFAQPTCQGGAATSFYEKGSVRIHYEEAGTGLPLLVIPGGGLNSPIAGLGTHPFNPMEEFSGEYRCIAADLRNGNRGQSSGPLEVDRPWDAHTDDHLGVMDHLGIDRFMVLGFCIAGPFIWNLLRRAPDRVVAAVLAQPSGWSPESPTLFYDNNMQGWGPDLVQRRPEITMDLVDAFLTKMYLDNQDFVFTVTLGGDMPLVHRDTSNAGAARDATHPDFIPDLDGPRTKDEVLVRRIREDLRRRASVDIDFRNVRRPAGARALSEACADAASLR